MSERPDEDSKTEDVAAAAKQAGATGCTRIYSASGEGMEEKQTFLGLTLETQRDVLLLLAGNCNSCKSFMAVPLLPPSDSGS